MLSRVAKELIHAVQKPWSNRTHKSFVEWEKNSSKINDKNNAEMLLGGFSDVFEQVDYCLLCLFILDSRQLNHF